MFKRIFNAAKDLSEKRSEPDASNMGAEGDKADELFAGMSFAQDGVLEQGTMEQYESTTSPATSVNANAEPERAPVMAEADEGLFSGLSMVSDPLIDSVPEQAIGKADDSEVQAASPLVKDAPLGEETKAPPEGTSAGEAVQARTPPLTSMRSPMVSPPSTTVGDPHMGLAISKPPPISSGLPTGNSTSALAALRPSVVRKKKRSIRVGYAREGDQEENTKGFPSGLPMSTPSDGTPMSQSPRSSIGDVSELQNRGREEEGGFKEGGSVDGHKDSGGVFDVGKKSGVNKGEVGTDASSETGVGSVSATEGAKDLEEVQSKGMIAVVLSSGKEEPSEGEVEKAELAAKHIEEERETQNELAAAQTLKETEPVEQQPADSKEDETETDAKRGTANVQNSQAVGDPSEPPEAGGSEVASLPTATSFEKAATDEGEAAGEAITSEQGTAKGALQRLETDLDIERIALEEQLQEEPPPTVESLGGLPLPEQVAQVRQYVEKRLAIIREKVAGEIATKKAAVQQKREAAERAAEAAARVAELEQQVVTACDEEDFEKADELTKEIESIEKEAAAATAAARAAEAESDNASARVRATAQEEVDVELQGASLLRAVIASAHANALRAQQSAEAAASEREASLQQKEDQVAERRRKVGLELRVIEEENAALRKKIDESTHDEVKEKEGLLESRGKIEEELRALRAAVAEKEKELAAQDESIAGVDARIAVVAAKFGRELKGLQADEERVSILAAELEAELERVAEERRSVAAAVEEAANKRHSLEETASRAELDAAQMEIQAKRKQGAAAAVEASQRRKDELAEQEKKLREEAEAVRERLGGLRASFQEVAVVKLRLQQELAAEEHKVEAADKRAPELDAEKKLAAQARNFKEAARLSAEAKALTAEREKAEAEAGRLRKELGAAEDQERTRAAEVAELETELTAKEREAATARCERLRLVAAAARREMDEAAEAEDFEEAGSLQAEAEAADTEAEQLKETHQLAGPRFEMVEHAEDTGAAGDDVSGAGAAEDDVSKECAQVDDGGKEGTEVDEVSKGGANGGKTSEEGGKGDNTSKERERKADVSKEGGVGDVVGQENGAEDHEADKGEDNQGAGQETGGGTKDGIGRPKTGEEGAHEEKAVDVASESGGESDVAKTGDAEAKQVE